VGLPIQNYVTQHLGIAHRDTKEKPVERTRGAKLIHKVEKKKRDLGRKKKQGSGRGK